MRSGCPISRLTRTGGSGECFRQTRTRRECFNRGRSLLQPGTTCPLVVTQSADDVSWLFPRRKSAADTDRDGLVCEQVEVCPYNRLRCVE